MEKYYHKELKDHMSKLTSDEQQKEIDRHISGLSENYDNLLDHVIFAGWNLYVLMLVERFPYEDLIAKDENGYTPLHNMMRTCEEDVIIAFIDKLDNDDLNTRTIGSKITPFYKAIIEGRYKVAMVLLERLPDINLVETMWGGNTPLHKACMMGQTDFVIALLEKLKPEDRFIINKKGKTALDFATTDEIKKLLTPLTKSAIC